MKQDGTCPDTHTHTRQLRASASPLSPEQSISLEISEVIHWAVIRRPLNQNMRKTNRNISRPAAVYSPPRPWDSRTDMSYVLIIRVDARDRDLFHRFPISRAASNPATFGHVSADLVIKQRFRDLPALIVNNSVNDMRHRTLPFHLPFATDFCCSSVFNAGVLLPNKRNVRL